MALEKRRNLVKELTNSVDQYKWTDWERDFIQSIQGREFDFMSAKQQEKVFQLVEKMDELH